MELFLSSDGGVAFDVPAGANTLNQVIFSSSGGFSNVFAIPEYQQSAIEGYMNKYAPDYPGQYNNSGKARGKL
jgi:tripeptidyl-peptidase-1